MGGSAGIIEPTGPPGVRKGYSAALESVRAIAALLVFARHIAGRLVATGADPGPPGFFESFAWGGQTGVTLFFVLSAFLLVPPFIAKAPASIPRFFARRFLRLWPIYLFAVFVATAWNAESLGDFGDGLIYLVYGQSHWSLITPLEPFSSVWWSLATEVQFYAVLGLCAFLGSRRFGRVVLGALLLFYAVAYAAFIATGFGIGDIGSSLSLRVSIFGRGWSFLLGGLAAWLYGRYGADWRARLEKVGWLGKGGGDALIMLTVVGIGLLLMKVETIGTWPAEIEWHAWHIPESALWAAFIIGLLVLPLRLRPFLVNRPLERLGILSYSFYLWHLPIIVAVGKGLGISSADPEIAEPALLVLAIALSFAGTFAASALTYRYIEKPFLLRKERLAE